MKIGQTVSNYRILEKLGGGDKGGLYCHLLAYLDDNPEQIWRSAYPMLRSLKIGEQPHHALIVC